MATQSDVRRIALALPATAESPERFAFSVQHKGKPKGFVWVWLERIHPKKARVPQRGRSTCELFEDERTLLWCQG